MSRLGIVCLVLALGGCAAGGHWEKPGATQADAQQASDLCMYAANANTHPPGLEALVYARCMEGNGWHSVSN